MKNVLSIFTLGVIVAGTATAVWLNKEIPPTRIIPIEKTIESDSFAIEHLDNPPIPLLQIDSTPISESVTYKNLQIFILYANAEIPGSRYVTLDNAMKTKKIRVIETENVNELKADNLSDYYIYINSGDIVRGGKQDRTIQYDVILSPHSKNVNLSSFCVEHDRWHSRENESTAVFNSSSNSLSSKNLKIAAKVSNNQSEVWDKVEEYQSNANSNIKYNYSFGDVNVQSNVSTSSLELTLENETVKTINSDYKSHILPKLDISKRAVGIACYINGKLASIDVYNNHMLFKDMFEKLIDAAISEAISEDVSKKYTKVLKTQVLKTMQKNSKLRSNQNVNSVTRFVVSEGSGSLLKFTTEDRNIKLWLHKNWLEAE